MGLLQTFGGVEGALAVAQQAPDLWEEACSVFDQKIDIGGVQLESKICRSRVEAMKRMLPQAQAQAQAMGAPEMVIQILVSSPETAVDPVVDEHTLCVNWYKKWANENEGQLAKRSNSPLYQAVLMQIQAHKQAQVQQEQEKAQMGLAAQAPMIQAQQAMQAQQQSQQQQMQGQQQAQEQGQQQQQAGMDQANKQADRDHELQMTALQQAHNSEMSAADRENALAIAKARSQKAKAS